MQTPAGLIQMATFRTSDHRVRGPMVLAILPFVSRRRGPDDRARSVSRPHDHLAVGTAVRAGTQLEVSPGTKAHQRLLEGRRNLHPGGGPVELPLSRRGFGRRDHRLLVFSGTRCGCGEALFRASFKGSFASPAARDQCGREPLVPEGDYRIEAMGGRDE